jgi:hypothetical protein
MRSPLRPCPALNADPLDARLKAATERRYGITAGLTPLAILRQGELDPRGFQFTDRSFSSGDGGVVWRQLQSLAQFGDVSLSHFRHLTRPHNRRVIRVIQKSQILSEAFGNVCSRLVHQYSCRSIASNQPRLSNASGDKSATIRSIIL